MELSEIIVSGEKDRKNLLEITLHEIIKEELENIATKTNIGIADKILELSILIKLKSELLLCLFSLERVNKRAKELKEDEEVLEILSIIGKGVSRKEFRPKGYVEVEDIDIPYIKLSRIVQQILEREGYLEERKAERNGVSIQEVMENVKTVMSEKKKVIFQDLFVSAHSKIEVVVTFLAVLILARNRFIKIVQKKVFEDIYLELNEKRRIPTSH